MSTAATAAVVAESTFSEWRCDRLRLVGGWWRWCGGGGGGGLSNDGVMKGEVGGDWEERLDKADWLSDCVDMFSQKSS